MSDCALFHSHTTSAQSRNPFVETALVYALTYISSHIDSRIEPASVTICADTDYYSQPGSSDDDSVLSKGRFVNFNVPLSKANKTGLGSSAALVTAFTAALLAHYIRSEADPWKTESGKARLHNLAQAAHCAAQGKIGSGFDIAAAVYGSCIYKRFSPAILEHLGDSGTPGFSIRLKETVDDTSPSRKWNTQIDKSAVGIPRGLRLVMCDVDCGSATPGMVKGVFSWRKENPEEAALLWETLQKGNEDLAQELRRLSLCPVLSTNPYNNLRDIILTIRSLIREMSKKAGVPIEPKVQTELLDACSQLPGVVGGVVPGAGGYDAAVLLIEDNHDTLGEVHRFLDQYKAESAGSEGATIGKVRLLGVKQEMEGLRAEDPSLYDGWLAR